MYIRFLFRCARGSRLSKPRTYRPRKPAPPSENSNSTRALRLVRFATAFATGPPIKRCHSFGGGKREVGEGRQGLIERSDFDLGSRGGKEKPHEMRRGPPRSLLSLPLRRAGLSVCDVFDISGSHCSSNACTVTWSIVVWYRLRTAGQAPSTKLYACHDSRFPLLQRSLC